MLKIESHKQTDKWIATTWICRECYNAEGANEEEAIANLKFHLLNIIPILENDVWVAQEKIRAIRTISRLSTYCDGKIAEARESKERAIRYLNMLENKENGPMGEPSEEAVKEKIKKAKYYVRHWTQELELWEAEKVMLNEN